MDRFEAQMNGRRDRPHSEECVDQRKERIGPALEATVQTSAEGGEWRERIDGYDHNGASLPEWPVTRSVTHLHRGRG
jgi:hypothetical protein